jgi:hypothetical protein
MRDLVDEMDDTHSLGPSATYRWWEGKHLSTISLGTLEDDPPYPFTPDGFSKPRETNQKG